MDFGKEFEKFAVKHKGLNSMHVGNYINSVYGNYISPTIIEERQLNVATMDVFSRLFHFYARKLKALYLVFVAMY